MSTRRPFTPKGGSEKHAVDSNRHHNIPLYASIGEIIDNSVEWGSRNIYVFVKWKSDPRTQPSKIVFIDDGVGMSPDKLSNSLVAGFHQHNADASNQIGRFGVGCTYAFLANCRRADVYSKERNGQWFHTIFDIDAAELDQPTKDYPPDAVKKQPPKEYEEQWSKLKSGTITIWSNFDRGHVDIQREELSFWISRAFRLFIGDEIVDAKNVKKEWKAEVVPNPKKITIFFNGEKLKAYDPLYAIPYRKGDQGGVLYRPIVIPYPKPDGSGESIIKVFFGLSPESWRKEKNKSATDAINTGERLIRGGGAEVPTVADSRKMSIIRNGREVSWLQDGFLYGRVDDIDRWWGIEIRYDAELDPVFNVQNVKYQVGLSKALRSKLREEISSTVKELRDEIQRLFDLDDASKKKDRKAKEEDSPDPISDLIDDEDLENVGDTDETPSDFLKKLITNATERKKILERLSDRKFVEEDNHTKRVPKDTNLLFEYHSKGGEVLMTRYLNHIWYQKMEECEESLRTSVASGKVTVEDLEQHYHEMKILWSLFISTLVISLATVSPNEVQQRIIDKVLSTWGRLLLDKLEKRDAMQDE